MTLKVTLRLIFSFSLTLVCTMPVLAQVGVAATGESIQLGSDETAILQASKPLVTRSGAWQTWNDHLHLQHGQEKIILLLKLTNGAEGRPKFTGLHVSLARNLIATLDNFGGSDTLSLNLTGKLSAGNTTLTVQGFGPSGGRLVWQLLTRKPVINAVSPSPIKLLEKVIVQGKNFSANAKDMKVLIGTKESKISSATVSEIQFTAPAHLHSGSHDLVAYTNSVPSSAFRITVRSNPEITFVNTLSGPPGLDIVISGSGFSNNPTDNVVKFGSIPARIISANESSIHCIIPDMHFPTWYVPITVTTFGVTSKGKAHIHVDMRVIPNDGIPMH